MNDNQMDLDAFNEYAAKGLNEVKTPAAQIIENPPILNAEGGEVETPVKKTVVDEFEEQIGGNKVDDTAKKQEEEKLAKEAAEKLAKEEQEKLAKEKEENKPLNIEELKKQWFEELKQEESKKELAKKEEFKKQEEEKLAKEAAEKVAKEQEEDANWKPESVYTKEESENLKHIEKEYPEINQALMALDKKNKAILDREVNRLRKESEMQILNYHNFISGQINPVIQTAQLTQAELEKKEVFTAHPDFQEITPKVQEWIESHDQDDPMREGFEKAFTKGSYKQIIKLYDTYKKLNGVSTPAVNVSNVDPALEEKARLEADKKAKEVAEKERLEKIKKEKAQNLGAVSGQNTEIDNTQGSKSAEDWFQSIVSKKK